MNNRILVFISLIFILSSCKKELFQFNYVEKNRLKIEESSPGAKSIKETAKELAEGKLNEMELLNKLCDICHTIRIDTRGIQKNKKKD